MFILANPFLIRKANLIATAFIHGHQSKWTLKKIDTMEVATLKMHWLNGTM